MKQRVYHQRTEVVDRVKVLRQLWSLAASCSSDATVLSYFFIGRQQMRLHFSFGDIRGSFEWKNPARIQKSGHLNIKNSPSSHKEVRASRVASGQLTPLSHSSLCFHPCFYFICSPWTQILSWNITKYLYFSIFFSFAAFTKAIMHHKRKGRRSYLTSRSFSRFSSGLWRELNVANETSFPLWRLSLSLQQLIGRFVLSVIPQTLNSCRAFSLKFEVL